jgi:S-adenosylmethionine synthetase
MFEKVNPCHPDKVADRIAGAIVDLAYTKSKNPKVAVEVLLGHGEANVIIESSEEFAWTDIDSIVQRIAGSGIALNLKAVKQDVHLAHNQDDAVRCGDNGIFKGCAPTYEQKLLTAIAASIYDSKPFDGKYVIKGSGKLSAPIFDVTVCQSHLAKDEEETLELHLIENYGIENIIINPLGEWTGGPDVDCGCTNRKLGSDMGDGVTGGGLHGKDLSKADVSVNIWCYLESIKAGRSIEACCTIGDETVNGVPYSEIVEKARLYIHTIGGFEKFAEWGLIRPNTNLHE